MKALLFAAALVCSPAHAEIYTTTPVRKPPNQVKAEVDAFLRSVYGNALNPYAIAPQGPTFEDQVRKIIRDELERERER